ncbi:hypothetical protein RsTz2092_05190 [Deferribacterales bacterium RsTz2092]|nr:hypothetical protein AGMMS49941_04020 [Deferribacterales bacterium]
MRFYLATANKHKADEYNQIFSEVGMEVALFPNYEAPIEDGMSFEENAEIKAVALSKQCNDFVLADDSGLEVAILHGEPGIFSARYAGNSSTNELNNKLLLQNMFGKSYRSARFVCAIALARAGQLIGTFRGECKGTIAQAPKGNNGFGYDSLFLVSPNMTMAELSPEEKNNISHRRNAADRVIAFLQEVSKNG